MVGRAELVTGELTERPDVSGRVVRGGDDVAGDDESDVTGFVETCRGCFVDHLDGRE